MKKESFVLYAEYLSHIELLTMEQRGQLFTAIMLRANEKDIPELDGVVEMAFSFIRAQMDRDSEKYREKAEKCSEAGKKGGRPKKEEKPEKAKKANAFSEKQTKAKKAYNDNVYVDDNEDVDDNFFFCPQADSEEEKKPEAAAGFTLPVSDGSLYRIPPKDLDKWKEAYPDVDIPGCIRQMQVWLQANPGKQKARNEIARFIVGWLSKEHKKDGRSSPPKTAPKNKFNNFHQRDYDFNELEKQLLNS